jgi:hypothetical protein
VGFKDISPHYFDKIWFDVIPASNKEWQEIYQALLKLCPHLLEKIAIEYQHPERPGDTYYMLVLDRA